MLRRFFMPEQHKKPSRLRIQPGGKQERVSGKSLALAQGEEQDNGNDHGGGVFYNEGPELSQAEQMSAAAFDLVGGRLGPQTQPTNMQNSRAPAGIIRLSVNFSITAFMGSI